MAGEVKHIDYKKDKKYKNLDDFFDHMAETHYKELSDSFKDLDNFKEDEHLNHLYNNIFTPGQDELYNKTTAELNNIFKDDNAKLHNKKEDIQKALVKGILAYFEKVHPGALKDFDKSASVDEQYKILSGLMDEFLGLDSRSPFYQILADQFAKDKKITVGHLKRQLKQIQAEHIGSAVDYLVEQKTNASLAGKHRIHIAAHVKTEAEKAGYTLDDRVRYSSHQTDVLLRIRDALRKGNWKDERGRSATPEHYGLRKKEKEKEQE
ncbi:hypothetical protein JW756_00695 [Candidatus Woesearchaeota archaeon]|nr:hypothetical protein [Candidatus Woesearchaeota archaeon]